MIVKMSIRSGQIYTGVYNTRRDTNRDKVRIKTGQRAMKFDEEAKEEERRELLKKTYIKEREED